MQIASIILPIRIDDVKPQDINLSDEKEDISDTSNY